MTMTTTATMELKAKADQINMILSEPDIDLWKLRELALTEGGLVNDTIRKKAWPKLVGLHGTIHLCDPHPIFQKGVTLSQHLQQPSDNSAKSFSSTLSHGLLDDAATVDSASSVFGKHRMIAGCLDSDQIERDVARCTWHLLSGSQRSQRRLMETKHKKKVASVLRRKQRRLANLINLTLARTYQDDKGCHRDDLLRYYQGYHDVASIFLAALGGGGRGGSANGRRRRTYPLSFSFINRPTAIPTTFPSPQGPPSLNAIAASSGLDLPSRVLGQVSRSHFRDAMRTNFLQLQIVLRLVIFPLMALLDPEVHSHLRCCEMEPFFAISWIITWFSHDVRDTELVKRLFDAFLVSHPLFSLYLSVAMVCHPVNRLQVLNTECDFACVHQTLSSLPRNSCMVGWKYKFGIGGYVSGEDEVEDGTVSTTDLDDSHVSEDFVVVDGRYEDDDNCNYDDDLSETTQIPMVTSGGTLLCSGTLLSRGPPAQVPFQQLIDQAISYMRRIPPRKLLGLAKRYYAEESIRPLVKELPSISLFQPPPNWALVSTTKADWVLKQRERGLLGLSTRSRKDRRVKRVRSPAANTTNNNSKASGDDIMNEDPTTLLLLGGSSENHHHFETPDEIQRYLKEKCRTLAVIASGFGPGTDENSRRRKQRRRLVLISIVACVAAVIVLRFQQQRSFKLLSSSTPSDQSMRNTCGGTTGSDAEQGTTCVAASHTDKSSPSETTTSCDNTQASAANTSSVVTTTATVEATGSVNLVPNSNNDIEATAGTVHHEVGGATVMDGIVVVKDKKSPNKWRNNNDVTVRKTQFWPKSSAGKMNGVGKSVANKRNGPIGYVAVAEAQPANDVNAVRVVNRHKHFLFFAWTCLRDDSIMLAQSIHRSVGSKVNALMLFNNDTTTTGHFLQIKSRELVDAVYKLARGLVRNVKTALFSGNKR